MVISVLIAIKLLDLQLTLCGNFISSAHIFLDLLLQLYTNTNKKC